MIFLLILCFSPAVFSQQRAYETAKITGVPPEIDGNFMDEAWYAVEWSGGFTQNKPHDGDPSVQRTEFKVLYDDENLYFVIRAWDTEAGKIVRQMSRKDNIDGDLVSVNIDSYNDKLTAFDFGVTASGVKVDGIIINDSESDATIDPVWYVKTNIDGEGWTAEMKIPFSQLRFGRQTDHEWGLQVWRWLFREEESSGWQYIPSTAAGSVSNFGRLTGITDIKPKKEVVFMPYLMGNMETYKKEEGNPYADGTDPGWSAGLDGKIAVSNDLTVNYTFNPDFGQVEADPSEVNLTTFETFFPERRPFFTEGSNIFSFVITEEGTNSGRDNLFYSRRIGRPPRYSPELAEGEHARLPEATRILGAMKLSGKTRNGWSVGVMESLTSKETARIKGTDGESKEVVEPATNYFNVRLQKDFNDGTRSLGGMLTATNRFIGDSSLNFLPAAAYTGGVDFVQYWQDKNYYLRFRGVFSHLAGDREAITALQRSPMRYYQRPDISHLSVDSSLTSLTGHGGTLSGGKIGGGHFSYGAFVIWRSPGLELNDQGYQREADLFQQVIWSNYRITHPWKIFRQLQLYLNQWASWNFSPERTSLGLEAGGSGTFKNYWGADLHFERAQPNLNQKELRGGPAIRMGGDCNLSLEIETDERKKLILAASSFHNWGDWGHSRFTDTGFELTWKPIHSLDISAGPEYTLGHRTAQYVKTIELQGEPRYIVSRIDQEVFAMNLRLNLSITPDITLQFWGQPFIFSGDYEEFKRVSDPRNKVYYHQFDEFYEDRISLNAAENIYEVDENRDGTVDYNFDNPDFKVFEFRSNLVFRWEYIPGSVLYFVWSQGRNREDATDQFDLSNDMRDLFGIHPRDIFQLKISYRLSI